jgi:hypothetical protein
MVALVTARRRRIENDGAKHPLKGSVQNRMNLFSTLADADKPSEVNNIADFKTEAIV